MENASKALLIAAEILIGVIILTVMALLFSRMLELSDSYQAKQETQKVVMFNVEYQKYETLDNEDKAYLTSEEVVTLVNKVLSWNRSTEDPDEEIVLTVNDNDITVVEDVMTITPSDIKDLIAFMVKSKKFENVLGSLDEIESMRKNHKYDPISGESTEFQQYLQQFDETLFECHIEYKNDGGRVSDISIRTTDFLGGE